MPTLTWRLFICKKFIIQAVKYGAIKLHPVKNVSYNEAIFKEESSMDTKLVREKSGLATAGMVLGIIGVVFSPMPIINNMAFILGVLALIFGIVGLKQTGEGKKAGRGKAIAGVVLGAVTLAIVILTQMVFSAALNQAVDNYDASQNSPADTNQPAAAWDMEAAYAKINNGMTKAEVEQVVGKPSENCTESQSEYIGKSEVCTYGNAFTDKGSIMVTYSQDKVSSKTKSTY